MNSRQCTQMISLCSHNQRNNGIQKLFKDTGFPLSLFSGMDALSLMPGSKFPPWFIPSNRIAVSVVFLSF